MTEGGGEVNFGSKLSDVIFECPRWYHTDQLGLVGNVQSLKYKNWTVKSDQNLILISYTIHSKLV